MTGQHSKQPSFLPRSGGAHRSSHRRSHRKSRRNLKALIFRPLTIALAASALAGAGIAAAGGSFFAGAPAALNHAGGDGPVSAIGDAPTAPGADPQAGSRSGGGRGGDGDGDGSRKSSSPRSVQAQPSKARSSPAPARVSTPAAVDGYANPLRAVSNLLPERIDMGVDFGGAGPVYALGDAVVTNATGSSVGWPGGGWITYRLTSGRDAGLTVYLAEDVRPTVTAGQRVSSSTVIANMFSGSAGIETGWAMPDGSSAESQLPVAGGISGNGPFPTVVGLNFEELLQKLGVPAAPNRSIAASGLLPAGYASW